MSIEVRNIHKTFGNTQVLRDVSLAVASGELVALLGPSGSGKTTLLRIIAGLEFPDQRPESKILFAGEDAIDRNARHRRVGFVFQHYALFRHLTVFENVAFGLRVRPRKTRPPADVIKAKVDELLQLISLGGLGHRYPSQLSGGQRQRVALARALATEPSVLLLDEPFGALDAKVRQSLRRWLRRLHDDLHVTSVFVTHDQEEALEVADRIVIMNRGRIEQIGSPEEVYDKPASEFVLEFLGNVNLFHGRVERDKAVFGSLKLDHDSVIASDGMPARLLVRPHELEIHSKLNGHPALRARIVRAWPAGPQVRVDLVGETGESLKVEMPHSRFHEELLEPGQDVYVSIREPRVYLGDYSI
jgi:sulfate transport system ATP-binding protein